MLKSQNQLQRSQDNANQMNLNEIQITSSPKPTETEIITPNLSISNINKQENDTLENFNDNQVRPPSLPNPATSSQSAA